MSTPTLNIEPDGATDGCLAVVNLQAVLASVPCIEGVFKREVHTIGCRRVVGQHALTP